MMDGTMVDLTFGLNPQALSVAQLLSERAPEFATYEDGCYDVDFTTKTFYNGRERGMVISMRVVSLGWKAPVLHIAIFEHWNTDGLCAIKWEGDFIYNAPTHKDIPKEAYSFRSLTNRFPKGETASSFVVDWGQIGEMVNWVYNQFSEYYDQSQTTKITSNKEKVTA